MMNIKLKKDIKMAFNIINDNTFFSHCIYKKYSVIPIRGTENSRELFSQFNCSFEKTLMVAGSGDQVLEAIFYGAKMIDTFDINCLAKYGCNLKFAAIKALEYEEYISFYCDKFPDYLYYKVRDFLDTDSCYFWDHIFDYAYNFDIYENLFDVDNHRKIITSFFSVNLRDDYYKIKDNLINSTISFTNCNLRNIADYFSSKDNYNFIYLSNIYYYLNQSYEEYSKLMLNSIMPLLKNGGEALIHYLYGAGIDELKSSLYSIFDDLFFQEFLDLPIRELETFMPLEKHLVECSGYGSPYGNRDVGLSLRK